MAQYYLLGLHSPSLSPFTRSLGCWLFLLEVQIVASNTFRASVDGVANQRPDNPHVSARQAGSGTLTAQAPFNLRGNKGPYQED